MPIGGKHDFWLAHFPERFPICYFETELPSMRGVQKRPFGVVGVIFGPLKMGVPKVGVSQKWQNGIQPNALECHRHSRHSAFKAFGIPGPEWVQSATKQQPQIFES